jgi:hypothetical protein
MGLDSQQLQLQPLFPFAMSGACSGQPIDFLLKQDRFIPTTLTVRTKLNGD